jgi:hypothetical protein
VKTAFAGTGFGGTGSVKTGFAGTGFGGTGSAKIDFGGTGFGGAGVGETAFGGAAAGFNGSTMGGATGGGDTGGAADSRFRYAGSKTNGLWPCRARGCGGEGWRGSGLSASCCVKTSSALRSDAVVGCAVGENLARASSSSRGRARRSTAPGP